MIPDWVVRDMIVSTYKALSRAIERDFAEDMPERSRIVETKVASFFHTLENIKREFYRLGASTVAVVAHGGHVQLSSLGNQSFAILCDAVFRSGVTNETEQCGRQILESMLSRLELTSFQKCVSTPIVIVPPPEMEYAWTLRFSILIFLPPTLEPVSFMRGPVRIIRRQPQEKPEFRGLAPLTLEKE